MYGQEKFNDRAEVTKPGEEVENPIQSLPRVSSCTLHLCLHNFVYSTFTSFLKHLLWAGLSSTVHEAAMNKTDLPSSQVSSFFTLSI